MTFKHYFNAIVNQDTNKFLVFLSLFLLCIFTKLLLLIKLVSWIAFLCIFLIGIAIYIVFHFHFFEGKPNALFYLIEILIGIIPLVDTCITISSLNGFVDGVFKLKNMSISLIISTLCRFFFVLVRIPSVRERIEIDSKMYNVVLYYKKHENAIKCGLGVVDLLCNYFSYNELNNKMLFIVVNLLVSDSLQFLLVKIKEQKTHIRNMVLKLVAIHYLPQIFNKDYCELVKIYNTYCVNNSIEFDQDYDTFISTVELVFSSVDTFQSIVRQITEFYHSESSINIKQIYETVKCFQTKYMVDVKNSTIRPSIHTFGSCCLSLYFVYNLRCILLNNILLNNVPCVRLLYPFVLCFIPYLYYVLWTEMYNIVNFVTALNSLFNIEEEIVNITDSCNEIKKYFETSENDESNLEVVVEQPQVSSWATFRQSCSSIGKELRKVGKSARKLRKTYNTFKSYKDFFSSMRKY